MAPEPSIALGGAVLIGVLLSLLINAVAARRQGRVNLNSSYIISTNTVWVRCHLAQPPQPRHSNLRSILQSSLFKCATNITQSATASLPLKCTYSRFPHTSGQVAMIITSGMLPSSLAAVLPTRALAQNATASDEHVGWVSSASGRSTSDILWSCFSILLVCTYKDLVAEMVEKDGLDDALRASA